MPRGARIVDEYGIVRDCDYLYVAYQGKSEYVGEGYVVKDSIVRKFWPKTVGLYEAGIVLEQGTYDSVWYSYNTGSAKAICYYIAQTGQVLLSEPGGVEDQFEVLNVINPPPRSQGVYLYKFDIVSGDIQANHPVGVWTDVNVDGTIGQLEYWIEQEGSGTALGQATMSFAEDDGLGAPIPATIKTITVDFRAEVIGKRICMTTTPWDLNNIEVNEPAEVFILTVPENWWDEVNGYYVERAYINGEFGFPKGIQESEVYACTWSPAVTVQVDQISGDPVTSPDGLSLGVPYSTDQRRRWKIEATNPGDVVNAVVDVTITDGSETVVKRITMRAEQVEEVADPGSEISTDFTREDTVEDYAQSTVGGANPEVRIGLYVRPDGTINMTTFNGGQEANFPQNWNILATAVTDPQNYECKISVRQQDSLWPDTAYSSEFWLTNWLNLNEERYYVARSTQSSVAKGTVTKTGEWTLAIREVGRPDTVKYKVINVKTQTKIK
jgi:hypothetical protein